MTDTEFAEEATRRKSSVNDPVMQMEVADLANASEMQKEVILQKLREKTVLHDDSGNVVGKIIMPYFEGNVLKATVRIFSSTIVTRSIAEAAKNISSEVYDMKYLLQ